ncbi:DUF4037 domain-containing protein [uncultured Bilophila sp.]|uniref:DUF4037 domain-containing protein n=2 Tax=uncultured Bilophila sp. TaxID=529385 RepID=UPI0025F7F626|nr:DUF4037 domain-containing protein [uncultured Bilophila sp.]
MKGLDLSRAFWEQCARPLFRRELPAFLDRAAIGLVGEGSECFGYDDEISRDHDWGPAFCLWLPQGEWETWTDKVEPLLARLPDSYEGFPVRMAPERRMGRVGPLSIEGFYAKFTGLPHPPRDWKQWRAVPEHFLAVCTNGAVFSDVPGTFTAFRDALLTYYPEDVRLKKMAARCMGMAQAGQYNLLRSLRRGETATCMLAAARFSEQAISMIFLLTRRYMPFYKWAHRGVGELPVLGRETADCVTRLAGLDWTLGPRLEDKAGGIVETLCEAVAERLRAEGLSDAPGAWLLEHGPSVQSRITTPELLRLPVMLE